MNKNLVKIWIYQSSTFISKSTEDEIKKDLHHFIKQWNAHGKLLDAKFEIKYSCFIILMVNESLVHASGCSIDSSVKCIKEIEEKYNLDLFNRFNTVWKKNDELVISTNEEFESLVKNQQVNAETILFNNTVLNLQDLENNWEIPAKDSWHYNYYNFT